jgi:CheY-like chemotaxis protein
MKKTTSILLVEDDKDDQEFFIEALSKIKNAMLYHIANNGKEALEKLKSSTTLPDLIFSDIHMPLMNGIECLADIIRNPRTSHIPVVMLTTDISKVNIVRQLGAKAFITKTSDTVMLSSQLEKMISQDFIGNNHLANQAFIFA